MILSAQAFMFCGHSVYPILQQKLLPVELNSKEAPSM